MVHLVLPMTKYFVMAVRLTALENAMVVELMTHAMCVVEMAPPVKTDQHFVRMILLTAPETVMAVRSKTHVECVARMDNLAPKIIAQQDQQTVLVYAMAAQVMTIVVSVEETVARVHFALVELSIVLVNVMVLLLKTVAEYAALSGPLALTRMKYFVTMV
jgi:hypothetical protein